MELDFEKGTTIFTDKNGLIVTDIGEELNALAPLGQAYRIGYAGQHQNIVFQNGTVPDRGINGATNEALIAILIDRLQHLNERCPCPENEQALINLCLAFESLEARTQDRVVRGVEGTETV